MWKINFAGLRVHKSTSKYITKYQKTSVYTRWRSRNIKFIKMHQKHIKKHQITPKYIKMHQNTPETHQKTSNYTRTYQNTPDQTCQKLNFPMSTPRRRTWFLQIYLMSKCCPNTNSLFIFNKYYAQILPYLISSLLGHSRFLSFFSGSSRLDEEFWDKRMQFMGIPEYISEYNFIFFSPLFLVCRGKVPHFPIW